MKIRPSCFIAEIQIKKLFYIRLHNKFIVSLNILCLKTRKEILKVQFLRIFKELAFIMVTKSFNGNYERNFLK